MKYPLSLSKMIGILGISLLLISCSSEQNKKQESEAPSKTARQLDFTDSVAFLDVSGDTLSVVRVALADTPESRNQGLMDVTNLPNDAGMLFIFPDAGPRSFWMANTPLSLDIIFADADSSIVRIHHSTSPYSDKSLTSGKPAQFVVETNGGYCISNDIREGMKISF